MSKSRFLAVSFTLPFVAFIFCACGSSLCRRPVEESSPALTISYSSGGLAPLIQHLDVYESGRLEYKSFRGSSRCSAAKPETVLSLLAMAGDPGFKMEMETLRLQRYDLKLADWEEIRILIGAQEVVVPVEKVPPVIGEFVAGFDRLFSRAFGDSYQPSISQAIESSQSE